MEEGAAVCYEHDISDDERDEEVARQLEMLKNMAKQNMKQDKHKTTEIRSSGTKSCISLQGPDWKEYDKLLVHISAGIQASRMVAGFDIDHTIITTQSGRVFPTHPGDWTIMLPEIPRKLKNLSADGYRIVFFTNQNGISKGKVKLPEYKHKIESILAKLGVPVMVLASTGQGKFRKPGLGMWNFIVEHANDGVPIDINKSFYVGDAAGRPEKWAAKKKKDFSCSDRLFALNAGLKFFTPEEYFQGQRPAPFNMPEFDPRALRSDAPMFSPNSAKLTSSKQEVIVFTGFPASGKSHFAKSLLRPAGYAVISRDELGSWQKCVSATRKFLQEGQSVVVDNTNLDPESRKRYTEVTQANKVPCRCFHFLTTVTHCRHNERFRELTDPTHEIISDMIFNSMKSKLKEPNLDEGFDEIVKVNFVPSFSDPEHERLYRQFLLDK